MPLSQIGDLADWRLGAVDRMTFERSGPRAPNTRVLAAALGEWTILEQMAAAPDFLTDPVPSYTTAIFTACTESSFRSTLYRKASVSPAADAIQDHDLDLSRLLGSLPPERLEKLLDAWDRAPAAEYQHERGPSVRGALAEWAARFGMKVRIGPRVADLQAGEYVLSLPLTGSSVQLDRSLRQLSLRARRSGLHLRVWLDTNLFESASGRVMRSAARTPAERLRAFLAAPHWAEHGLQDLVPVPPETSTQVFTRYTPRLERPASLSEKALEAMRLATDRPLAGQVHLLAARGYRLEAAEGVLRIVSVR
jgi:hypothetical protein